MTATTHRRRKGLLEVLHRQPEETTRRLAVENLVSAKLEIPEPAVAVIARPRLFARLDVATTHRVTVLDAPVGSGKTVLLASWLRERPRQAAAWLSLDEGDNRPTVFWAYLLASLGRVCPSLTGLIMPTGLEAFIGELARRLAGVGRPVVLVLDDAHLLRDQEVLAGLDTLLRRAPATLRLVLVGRGQPALALARLRVSGHVDDITFADLAGTAAEAAHVLALWGADLPPAEVRVVMAQTEGWMGGFRLAALWRAAQPDAGRVIETFTGDERVVADYLRDEVFRPLPEATRQFLLRTCLFDRLNGSLADSLTGEHRGSVLLDQMERDSGLVAVDGPSRGWFRYRPLLRQFLRAELSRELPCEIDELRRRAAHWYAERRLTADAVRAAVDGKDWDFAISLVAAADRAVLAGNRSVFEPVLRRIPGPLLETNPALAAVFADLRLTDNDPEAAEPYLRLAERAPEDGSADLAHRLRCSELRLLQASLRGSVSAEQIEVASELLDAGEAALPGAAAVLGLLASRIGLALIWTGRLVSARLCLERALRYPDMEPARRRRMMEWTALLLAIEGRLAGAEELLGELNAQGRPGADGGSAEPASLLSRLGLARLYLERERLNEAWRLLVDAPGEPDQQEHGEWGEPPLVAVPALQRAEVLIARGQGGAVRAELETIRKRTAGRTASDLHHADLLEVRLLLAEGNPARAREVLNGTAEHGVHVHAGMRGALVGDLLLAEGDPAQALTAVAPYLVGEVAEARLLDVVSAHLVAAAAHRRLGVQAKAEEQLRHALALAEPHRPVRVFVRAGRLIRSLLTVAVPQDGPYGSMRAMLLHNFDAQATPWEDDVRPIRLTASEAAILTFLPGHPTNEEIAADLFVSVNTVKTHLRSLYRKLGVASRREAVARARQRGLLPD
jgi:LuxR family transcriptional regulator, maltose regulon positive regulatory protein